MTATLADRVAASRGWARRGIALAAGLVSVLAMAPFFLWPVLFVTLPVLVWLIDGSGSDPGADPDDAAPGRDSGRWQGLRSAFGAGWWFGFGYFAAGLFWIGEAFLVEADIFAWLLPVAVTAMPAGLALFYGCAAAAARAVWPPGIARLLLLAAAFAGAEWLRGHVLTGFPWNVLGYALTASLPQMQMAGLIGIYGLTLWAVLIFTAPLVLAADGERAGRPLAGRITGVSVALLPLALSAGYGAIVLSYPRAEPLPGVLMRVVQPSIPQREKWKPEKQREIFLEHLGLSRTSPSGVVDDLAGVTHVVWPEAAMPFLPLSTPEALDAIGALLPDGVRLITGALRLEEMKPGATRREAYNSLMVFDADGRLATLYDKIHLVPFGEYLPFQQTLESIGLQQLSRMRGGFSIGPSPRPLVAVEGLPAVGALICYEAIFPAAVVQGPDRPGLLINITNDGWFGNTTGPHQHLHQSRIRAIEEGVPLIRAANNGVSALFDAEGRMLQRLALDQRGVFDTAIPARRTPPPYARFGDAIFMMNAIVFLLLALRKNRSKTMSQS